MSHQSDVAVVERGGHRAAAAAIVAGHADYPSFRHLFGFVQLTMEGNDSTSGLICTAVAARLSGWTKTVRC
jgi:hypothetical protein